MFRTDMLKALLEGFEMLQCFHEPPEEIAPQFVSWTCQVSSAFQAAGMAEERELWDAAAKNVRFSPEDSAMVTNMQSMKAVLLAFLDWLEIGLPNDSLFDLQIVNEARNYVHRVAIQAIGCYERAGLMRVW